jgi:hypothetical protein
MMNSLLSKYQEEKEGDPRKQQPHQNQNRCCFNNLPLK